MNPLQVNTYKLNKSRQYQALPLLCLFLLCLLTPTSSSYGQAKTPQEYGLKSIYLYNFLQFVEWPTDKCPQLLGKVKEIAVLGTSPIGKSLQDLQEHLKKTQNTEITLRFLGPYVEGMDLSGCRLLFITQSELKNTEKILASIKDEAVLTVADSEEVFKQGCMVVLLSRMNKVRWAVNRKPTKKAGLRLASRVLAMAVEIVN